MTEAEALIQVNEFQALSTDSALATEVSSTCTTFGDLSGDHRVWKTHQDGKVLGSLYSNDMETEILGEKVSKK